MWEAPQANEKQAKCVSKPSGTQNRQIDKKKCKGEKQRGIERE